jgi:hypothetical protein
MEGRMTDICLVEDCDRPVSDAWTCTHCAWKLERALGNVAAYADELDVVLSRQARYEEHSDRTKGTKVTPLFFDDRASEAGWVLRNTLSTWVRLVAEERGIPLPEEGGTK